MTARSFDVARFAELRQERGLGWGAPLVYSHETGSTNDDALAAARAGGESGSVFLADHQTHGRGRRGKVWVAAPGQHLLFSILLRDPVGESRALAPAEAASGGVGALTLAVGLGVRAALAAHSRLELAVKWPNDVLARPHEMSGPHEMTGPHEVTGPRKLAGILCEGQFVGSQLAAVVIGIGINVLEASYPPELEAQVTCLERLAPGDRALEREALLVAVLAAVESRVRTYLGAGFGALLEEFTRHDALAGERVEVSGASPMLGTARGVDAAGRLLVDSDGLLVPVISGTVRAVRG